MQNIWLAVNVNTLLRARDWLRLHMTGLSRMLPMCSLTQQFGKGLDENVELLASTGCCQCAHNNLGNGLDENFRVLASA
jgi:hypothetical protein